MLFRRLGLSVGVFGLVGAAAVGPAWAMGSGDAYENMQVGVTYTVYEPSFTAGLKAQHIGGNDLCPKGTEENLLASYGKRSGRQFTIWEGNPMCSDIGVGQTVLTTMINGAKATVVAYCDPASNAPCNQGSVNKYGGHLDVTLPAAPGLRETRVWIETYSSNNLSAQQLVQIAKSLTPVKG